MMKKVFFILAIAFLILGIICYENCTIKTVAGSGKNKYWVYTYKPEVVSCAVGCGVLSGVLIIAALILHVIGKNFKSLTTAMDLALREVEQLIDTEDPPPGSDMARKKKEQKKFCPRCGAWNDISRAECFACGEKFH